MQAKMAMAFLVCLVALAALAAPGRAAETYWWGSDDPFENWHLGLRGGTYHYLSVDQGYFDRHYMGGLFYQTPMIEESNWKFEFALDYGEHEGDETVVIPMWIRNQYRPLLGPVVDSQTQAKWKGTIFQFRVDAMWFPFYVPGERPNHFQPYLFTGLGWSGQDSNLRVEVDMPDGTSQSIRVDFDSDNVLMGQFGAGFQFALHPRAVLDCRLGLDVYTNSDFADGLYYVSLGMGF